ncbi:MAG: ATP-dependent DNA ligase [Candidatus Bathyarchaeia archaeon]
MEPFLSLAKLCEALEGTTKRNEKVAMIGKFLRSLSPDEIAPAIPLIIGWIFPEADSKPLELGYTIVSSALKAGRQGRLLEAPLTIKAVRESFERIANTKGPGSRGRKKALLEGLLAQSTELEAKWILKNIFGEMQHGVNEGIMLDAIAKASGVSEELVQRAYTLTGDLGKIASIALSDGALGLSKIGLEPFRAIKPMLAEMSYDVSEVLAEHGGITAFEYKFDGARIQIHRKGSKVRIFSRRLSDVTESLPEILEIALNELSADEYIVEGEVLAMDSSSKPLPFQDLMRRFRRVKEVEEKASEIPLRLYLFDILRLGEKSLIDEAYEDRWNHLRSICPEKYLAKRIITSDPEEAMAFLKEAMEAGHEGLMAKALTSPYSPGKRSKYWFKIKPFHRLDLIIVAADWGYGRRQGWLSDYYLAAFDEVSGRYELVGKTFKGLKDEEFEEMTKRLLSLKVSETEHTVTVKPEVVVEVAFNEVQRSPRYRSGYALRFARIVRIRDDKSPKDVDTLETVRRLFEAQFKHKGRLR